MSIIEFASGRRGTGKSTRILASAVKNSDRILIADANGEYDIAEIHKRLSAVGMSVDKGQSLGSVYVAESVEDALAQVVSYARLGIQKWIIVSPISDTKDAAVFARAIAPQGGQGISAAYGGMAFFCDEVDVIAPNNASISPEVRTMFRSSRHHSLNIYTATTRPRDVHRIVTALANTMYFFRQHETRDLEYVASMTNERVAAIVRTLPQRSYAQYDADVGVVYIKDAKGRSIDRVGLFDVAVK